ncbi:superoxide dismutase [Candidatus Paracaedimonas acanthamoebae]|nr:superoxide dismutase [Candidatus Paracaedimonas acanthamoebae]
MAFTLPPLPYGHDALEPYLSERTLDFHYGKHHQAYVTNLNTLLLDAPDLAASTLEEIIIHTAQAPSKSGIFNNAAQVWNHTFLWNSMTPNGGGEPQKALALKINEDFGNFSEFKNAFKQAGITQFGSGWAWLVVENGKLKITKTSNADLPMIHGQVALLTCDVWEHAYYLDYQNRRPDYLEIFLNHLANWRFAEENFLKAIK